MKSTNSADKTETQHYPSEWRRVSAYDVPQHLWTKTGLGGEHWLIECPFCGEIHVHGAGSPVLEESRSPHCSGKKPREEYVLRFAGDLPKSLYPAFGKKLRRRI